MAVKTQPPIEKLPPFSSDAEEATLGALLIDGDALADVEVFLEPADFFRESNRWVYEACQAVYARGDAINQITVSDELSRQGKLEEVGGPAYLGQVLAAVPTSLHAEYYARIVQRSSLMRQLIQTAGRIAGMAYEGPVDVDGTLAKAEELLFQIRRAAPGKGFRPIREIVEGFLEEQSATEQTPATGIPTGFTDLDNLLGGLRPADLITVAARPGMGKSSLLLNMAVKAAKGGARVGMFSLEMASSELCQRAIAAEAGVDLTQLRLNRLSDSGQRRVVEATGELSELPLCIDDSASLKIGDIRARAKRLSNQRGLDVLMVDHIGLLHAAGRFGNRQEEVSEIAKGLKVLAKDLNIPVVMASQLSRAVESRTPHIPILSDLRETGETEQSSDIVMFIYREDYYVSEDEWNRREPTKPYPKGVADIIIAKHRNGPTGQVPLMWFERTTNFGNIELYRSEPGQGRLEMD